MKKLHALCACVAVMLAASAIRTEGSAAVPPGAATEIILPVTVLPDVPFEQLFPNVLDPLHPKLLIFDGFYISAPPTDGNLVLQFDWFDLAGVKQYSPGAAFPLSSTGATPINETWKLDFCPREVSIHFHLETTDPQARAIVAGDFTHICQVPESLSGYEALALVGLLCGRAALRTRSRTRS